MTQSYTFFQTEDAPQATQPRRPLLALGFIGRVLEGTGIVAFTLVLALLSLTTAARADTLLAGASAVSTPLVGFALLAVFTIMLALVRNTWRQTSKGIQTAPRRLHRVG